MKNLKLKEQITLNYASLLGAAIRNSLNSELDQGRWKDAETASERLESLLKRMVAEEQFDAEILADVLLIISMQAGVGKLLKSKLIKES